MAENETRNRHERLFATPTPLFYAEPIELVRGEGVWLFDADGRRYLDAYNNVPCVGHSNPVVTEAMAKQAATLNVHSRYMHSGVLDFAERLCALHQEQLSTVVFSCTGSEANEVAVMMARTATGKTGMVTTDSAYHGNTTEIRRFNSIGSRPGASEDAVIAVPVPTPDLAASLDALRQAIDKLKASSHGFAGVLMCSILANEGLPTMTPSYMSKAAIMVREAGGVFIADEVQAGYGRSGDWWGYETSDFEPDIVTMGKPMGAGLPLSATVASRDLVSKFRSEMRYFNTFAATPLQAAVGMAVIDEIEELDLVENSRLVGEYLLAGIKECVKGIGLVSDTRGTGLFVAIDWVDGNGNPDRTGASDVVEAMKDRGVLMGQAGANGNSLKIRPPLVFNKDNVDLLVGALEESIKDVV